MPQAKKSAQAPDDSPDAAAAHGADERLIKKYPNRRLYDTRHSAYITLQDVKTLVLGAERFRVVDAKTGEDLTRAILLQIILEEETGGVPLFSAEMLSSIIRVYGHAMQGMMGQLLAKNIELMTQLQGQLSEHSKGFYEQSAFHPEAWTQLLQSQAPIMQNMLGGAAEQSRQAFVKMQEDFQRQLQQAFSPEQFLRHMPGFKTPGRE